MDPNLGLQRVSSSNRAWPLHDTDTSRLAEQAALATQPPHALMERAGLAVARLALALVPHARRIHVWAGPGNNGGDGLVAARHLLRAGKGVAVSLLADASRLPPGAAHALEQAQQAGVPIQVGEVFAAESSDLAIDALLGLGSRRAPEGALAEAIAAISGSGGPVLAVDIPSGLHPDTGMLLGAAAVRATATLALLTIKPCGFTGLGRDHAGDVWYDCLGQAIGAPSAWLAGPPSASPRAHATHKGSFGDVAVVGGAAGMVGAAWLAAQAALAAGAGRVYCSLLDPAATGFDPARPELMGRPAWWLSPPALLAATTVVCGCGGGDPVRAALPALLSHVRRLVLDADALNAIASDSALQPLLRARDARGLHTLLTPHPLEAARLLGSSAEHVQSDRIAAARELSGQWGCAVLLKGSGSVVAAPGQLPSINPTGNGALASAGTGDVLAGWIGGLWAANPRADASQIASASAWQHGIAADRWLERVGTGPMRACDLIEAMARPGPR